jgi:hypothetical protein
MGAAITLEGLPPALLSTRNRPRTAVRRGAADRRRSDRAVAWWGSSLACWRWPHRRAVMVAERRRRCLPPEHGSASGRPSARHGGPDVGMPVVAWGRPVRILGQRPRVRCPVSARAVSARAVSARAMSARPVPNVRVSIVRGVRRRCPRSASPSASVVSARVPSWSASGSHTAEPAQAVLGQRSRRAGPGRRRGGARAADRVRSHGRPGTRRLRRIARRSGGAGRRAVHPKLWHGCAQVVRAGLAAGGRP